MKSLITVLTFWVFPKALRRDVRRYLCSRWLGRSAYRKAKVGRGVIFLGPAQVSSHVVFEEGVSTSGLEIVGNGPVRIGAHSELGPDCLVLTQNHNYDWGKLIPFGDDNIVKGVEIGSCVWIGQRVTLLPGTRIGEGAIIQAGAVVHGEIPPYAIAGGNPAVVFARRDSRHYEELQAIKAYPHHYHTRAFC